MEQQLHTIPSWGPLIGVTLGFIAVAGVWYFSRKPRKVLDPQKWVKFPLIEKEAITTGVPAPVFRFRFGLPSSSDVLGLPVGQHIYLRANVNGEEVMRPYTPTSNRNDKGFFDLVVKVYPKGRMSNFLSSLSIGSMIEVRGPTGRFVYQANQFKKIGLIAGGTGLTPMLQIINEILNNSEDQTQISFINANVTEQDIILKDKLDELAKQFASKFSIYYTLNEPPQGWTQGAGFVTKEMIRLHLPPPTENDIKILVCGPPPMTKAVKTHLSELGYTPEQILIF